MAVIVKGRTKYKAEKAIAEGEEVEIDTRFEVAQEDFDRHLTERLSRAGREEKEKIRDLEKQITDLKGGSSDTEGLKKKLEGLEAELSQRRTAERIDKALRDAKASDIPDEFRDQIKVAADATDSEIKAEIKRVVGRVEELKKTWGAGAGSQQQTEDEGIGRFGSGGSQDLNDEKKLKDGLALVRQVKPNLMDYIDREVDTKGKLRLIESYKRQGLLEPKKP